MEKQTSNLRGFVDDTKATPGGPVKNFRPMYSLVIHGWDFSWLELLVARLPPSSSHSNSSNQLKSQPYISGECIRQMFLVTGAVGIFGVAPVWASPACQRRRKEMRRRNKQQEYLITTPKYLKWPSSSPRTGGLSPTYSPVRSTPLQSSTHLWSGRTGS